MQSIEVAEWFDGVNKGLRMMINKKRLERYKRIDGAFVVPRPCSTILGQIINIGRDGLSFKYIDNGLRIIDIAELDIFIEGKGVYMRRVPVLLISDFNMRNENRSSSIHLRQCNVQFGGLTARQIHRLENFINV